MCTAGFASAVFTSWVNARFLVAPVRRDILIWWLGGLTDSSTSSGEEVCVDSSELLASLTPNKQQLMDMILTVYHGVVKPSTASHDAVMAQVEGCVCVLQPVCGMEEGWVGPKLPVLSSCFERIMLQPGYST